MRVVNLCSIAHFCVSSYNLKVLEKKRKGLWDQFMAYSFSKLLVVHMTTWFAKKAEKIEGSRVTCVHPGFVRTAITKDFGWIDVMLEPISWLFFINRQMGAQTVLYCVFEASDKLINGGYYSRCRQSRSSAYANSESLMAESIRFADS